MDRGPEPGFSLDLDCWIWTRCCLGMRSLLSVSLVHVDFISKMVSDVTNIY